MKEIKFKTLSDEDIEKLSDKDLKAELKLREKYAKKDRGIHKKMAYMMTAVLKEEFLKFPSSFIFNSDKGTAKYQKSRSELFDRLIIEIKKEIISEYIKETERVRLENEEYFFTDQR